MGKVFGRNRHGLDNIAKAGVLMDWSHRFTPGSDTYPKSLEPYRVVLRVTTAVDKQLLHDV